MNNSLDNKIKTALNKKAENISPNESLLNAIKNNLNEERENTIMKKLSFRPRILVAALALTAVLASGVIAAGKIAYIRSSSSRFDDIKHFPTLEEVEDIVDFSPKYTENLGTHKFEFANPGEAENVDDKGNVVNQYKNISFWYETTKDNAILTLSAHPEFEGLGADEKAEPISYDGITLYYSSALYKAVPPEYVPTEEDKKLEESGDLMIGYGSDKVTEQKTQSVIWTEEGITYNLMDMGEEIEKSEFIEMAKEVIDVR